MTAATGNRISGPFPQGFKVPQTTPGGVDASLQDWLKRSTQHQDALHAEVQGPPMPPGLQVQQIPDRLPNWLMPTTTY